MLFLKDFIFDGALIDSTVLEVDLERVNNIKTYWKEGTTNQIVSVFQNIPPIYIKIVGEVEVNPYIQ
jgi:hypothetical protein